MTNPLIRRLLAAFVLLCALAPAVVVTVGCEAEEEPVVAPGVEVDD